MKQSNNKLKLIRDILTLTYNYRDTYYIDIQINESEEVIEGWLFDIRYGFKDCILADEYNNSSKELDNFKKYIEIMIEDCISEYKENHF